MTSEDYEMVQSLEIVVHSSLTWEIQEKTPGLKKVLFLEASAPIGNSILPPTGSGHVVSYVCHFQDGLLLLLDFDDK